MNWRGPTRPLKQLYLRRLKLTSSIQLITQQVRYLYLSYFYLSIYLCAKFFLPGSFHRTARQERTFKQTLYKEVKNRKRGPSLTSKA